MGREQAPGSAPENLSHRFIVRHNQDGSMEVVRVSGSHLHASELAAFLARQMARNGTPASVYSGQESDWPDWSMLSIEQDIQGDYREL